MNEIQPPTNQNEDNLPPLEDAAIPEVIESVIAEDDAEDLIAPESRLLEQEIPAGAAELETSRQTSPKRSAAQESDSDAGWEGYEDSTADDLLTGESGGHDWPNETSAHKLIVALRSIETDIKAMLEERDTRRKRKLTGTRRWRDLEDDIMSWRFTGRFDEASLRRMLELIAHRHALFNRLRFISGTRPTWNS